MSREADQLMDPQSTKVTYEKKYVGAGEWTLKRPAQAEKEGVVTCRVPKIEGSRGFLVEQRAKHWAEL